MYVDVALPVCFSVCRLHHEHQVELLGALAAVFQHRAHSRIAVDVGIFALDVRFDSRFVRQVIIDSHESRVHLADATALCTIEDIGLGCPHKAVLNERLLHGILNVFDARDIDGFVGAQPGDDLTGDVLGCPAGLCAVCGLKSHHDGIGDLGRVEIQFSAIPLDDVFEHLRSLRTHYIAFNDLNQYQILWCKLERVDDVTLSSSARNAFETTSLLCIRRATGMSISQ